MTYEENRNKIIRKYIDAMSRSTMNWFRHDPKANFEHRKKVNEICNLLLEKKIEFICRPEVRTFLGWIDKDDTRFPDYKKNYPDILLWIKTPFMTKVIEVVNTESEEHANNKNYPKEFKVISIGVDEEFELNE